MATVLPDPAVGLVEKPYADLMVDGASPLGAVVAAGEPPASSTTSDRQRANPARAAGHTGWWLRPRSAAGGAAAALGTSAASEAATATPTINRCSFKFIPTPRARQRFSRARVSDAGGAVCSPNALVTPAD